MISDASMKHLFTVDVEEWFDGLEVQEGRFPSRLQMQVERLLNVLDITNTKATFFWLASRARGNEDLIRRIINAGHELGCHGWTHDFLDQQAPDKLKRDLRNAKAALEDIAGVSVNGFRAPNFSIGHESIWIFDLLREIGFTYDSSVHPIVYWRYGFASFPQRPTVLTTPHGELLELPISVTHRHSMRIPYAGGAYFRLHRESFIHRSLELAEREGEQVMFYFHPWELDAEHPRIFVPSTTQITHYWKLADCEAKLTRLLERFTFTSVAAALEAHSQAIEVS